MFLRVRVLYFLRRPFGGRMEMVIQVIVGGIAARQFVGKMLQTKIARAISLEKIDFTLLFRAPEKKMG